MVDDNVNAPPVESISVPPAAADSDVPLQSGPFPSTTDNEHDGLPSPTDPAAIEPTPAPPQPPQVIAMHAPGTSPRHDEEAIEHQLHARGSHAPRLTPADIDAQIVGESYARGSTAFAPATRTELACITLCALVLRNGFVVIGHSACASPENYDEEIGRRIARENARKQIWALEGYVLRSKLAGTHEV